MKAKTLIKQLEKYPANMNVFVRGSSPFKFNLVEKLRKQTVRFTDDGLPTGKTKSEKEVIILHAAI